MCYFSVGGQIRSRHHYGGRGKILTFRQIHNATITLSAPEGGPNSIANYDGGHGRICPPWIRHCVWICWPMDMTYWYDLGLSERIRTTVTPSLGHHKQAPTPNRSNTVRFLHQKRNRRSSLESRTSARHGWSCFTSGWPIELLSVHYQASV